MIKKPVILCVDDDQTVLISLKDQISRYAGDQYMLETAESGEEAMDVLEELLSEDIEVPLIITDQIMPGMKGDELLSKIHKRHPESLKIFLTGQADAMAVGNAVNKANLYRYISKPWDEADFRLTITEALRSFEQSKQLKEKQALLEALLEQERNSREALRKVNEGLEERVRLRTEEYRRAMEDAKQANKAKSIFLANMSHEIRTPMNAILGFTEILLSEIENAQHNTYLNAIQSSGQTLLSIINDILDLSKIESGTLTLNPEPIRFGNMCRDISEMFTPQITVKGLNFEADISDSIPDLLVLDEVRMRQVLINLIGNSIKFTDKGSVKLIVGGKRDPVSDNVYHLKIVVEDTGIGIPENQYELVFQPFQQQLQQKFGQYGGTGLGLTITQKIVEMIKGEIHIEKRAGKGSRFIVNIPDIEVPPDTTYCNIEKTDGKTLSSIVFEPCDILVIDDDKWNRKLISAYLKDTNIRLIEMKNGNETFAWMEENLPGLILMDLIMPEESGWNITKKIRTRSVMKDIPIIALTASGMKEDEEKISEFFDGYLRKPVSREKLIRELIRFLPFKELERTGEWNDEKDSPGKTKSDGAVELSSELAEKLRRKILPKWKEIRNMYFIDDVSDFAEHLLSIANSHQNALLKTYAETLLQTTRMSDVENIDRILNEFPALLGE